MSKVDDHAHDILFREARTHNVWLEQPVSDETLQQLYDLMKWGPTSANCSPARIHFLRSKEAKERLRPTLSPGNVEKTMKAPVTAIIAYDLRFFDQIPKLFPQNPQMGQIFANDATVAQTAAFRNGSLQGGYFILAARAVGLDCGPMSGFNNDKLDEEFFKGTGVKSNFICNLGYGDRTRLYPRNPRLSFDEACHIL